MEKKLIKQTLAWFLMAAILVPCAVLAKKNAKTAVAAETLFVAKALTDFTHFNTGIEAGACDSAGNIYAVGYKVDGGNAMGKVTPAGVCSLFINRTDGSSPYGNRFNSKGEMLYADHSTHKIWKVNMSTRAVSRYALLSGANQPNDIAITSKNVIFASDPAWTTNPTGNIWRIDTSGNNDSSHTATLLVQNMGATNGIEVNPLEDKLYVTETTASSEKIFSYTLANDGTLSNPQPFHQFANPANFNLDGMRCDSAGNVYVTLNGTGKMVVILSPAGVPIDTIVMIAGAPTNLCFGGPDGRTVYVMISLPNQIGRIEYFRTNYPGREWVLSHRSSNSQAIKNRQGLRIVPANNTNPSSLLFDLRGKVVGFRNLSSTSNQLSSAVYIGKSDYALNPESRLVYFRQ